MEDPKALQLFREVLAKTEAGRIRWEPTASDLEYFSVLPGGFTIVVRPYRDWDNPVQQYLLVLSNGDQELLRVTPDVDEVGLEGLEKLHEFARRRALRVDEAVDKLLGELAKL
jgi:hypothetical protein